MLDISGGGWVSRAGKIMFIFEEGSLIVQSFSHVFIYKAVNFLLDTQLSLEGASQLPRVFHPWDERGVEGGTWKREFDRVRGLIE